jgi:hypothetical protein
MSNAITDIEKFPIYSDRAVQLLEAFNINRSTRNGATHNKNSTITSTSCHNNSGVASSIGVRGRAHFSDSEDDESEDADGDNSQGSRDNAPSQSTPAPNITSSIASKPNVGSGSNQKKHKNKKTKEQLAKHIGPPPTASITIEVQEPSKTASAIQLPTALLPPEEEEEINPYIIDEGKLTPLNKLYTFAENLNRPISSGNDKNLILILMLQSGRFAAAIFHKDRCIKHTTSTRYTTRKGQGGSQSSNDNAKGKANSIGSQLRRAGEAQLRQDVAAALREWSGLLGECALFFISLSKNLQKGFWEDAHTILGGDKNSNFYKKSPYVVGIPLDVGKPSYEGCCAVYDLMTICVLQRIDLDLVEQEQQEQEQQEQEQQIRQEASNLEVITEDTNEEALQILKEEVVFAPLTPLHEAARDGNIEDLIALLSRDDEIDDLDTRVGPESMTPLHYAASASNDPDTASKCVHTLLVQGHANPCIFDSRNRPPYFLAENENIRNAFRRARAELGEEKWKWTESAKVASPLSAEDLSRKKDKAADKKRKQRQRQKERKAKEKADNADAERKTKEEEERKQRDEDAKRARAGLKPKQGGSSLNCDFCQIACKRKSQMFARLDYLYCSTDCVKKHQRELMAAAASARFNNK